MPLQRGVDSGADYGRTGQRRQQTQQPQQQYWWFRGVRYGSYSSYVAAVHRFNQSQYQQQQREAEQRALQAAAARRRQQLLSQYWANIDRMKSRQRTNLLREAERERLAEAAELERKKALALARIRREAALKSARTDAYETLRAQTREMQDRAFRSRMGGAQQEAADRLAGRDQRRVGKGPMVGPGGKVGKQVGESGATKRRREMLDKANDSGNYDKVFEWIERTQRNSGGRYYDEELYVTAVEKYNEQVEKVSDRYEDLREKVNDLADKGDLDKAWALLQSEGFKEAEADVQRVIGDPGRGKGQYIRMVRLSQQIAKQRDAYLERVYLGLYANRDLINSGQSQLDAARRQFAQQWGGSDTMQRGFMEGLERPQGSMSLRTWVEWQQRVEQQRIQQFASMTIQEKMKSLGFAFRGREGYAKETADGEEVVLTAGEASRWLAGDESVVGRSGAGIQVWQEENLGYVLSKSGKSFKDAEALYRASVTGSSFKARSDAKDALVKMIEDAVRAAYPFRRPAGAPSNARIGSGTHEAFIESKISEFLGYLDLDRPQGLVGALDKLSRAPIVGQALGALDFGRSAIWSSLWDARVALYGRESLGVIDTDKAIGNILGLSGSGGNIFERVGQAWDYSPEGRAEAQALYDEYRRVMDDPDMSWEERAHAIMAMGSGARRGLSTLLLDLGTDPLALLAPARFARAGSLAISEAGGVQRALAALGKGVRMGEVPTVLKDYGRFATPQWFRKSKAGEVSIINAQAFKDLSKAVKIPVPELRADFTPAALRELVEGVARGQKAEELAEHIGAFGRLWEEKPQSAQQLMSWAQAEFAKQQGLFVNPLDLRHQIDEAIRMRDETQRALAAAEEVEQAVAARAAARAPLSEVRVERELIEGVPAPPRAAPKVSPEQSKDLNRLERAVQEALVERAEVARQAASFAEQLKKLGPGNVGPRQGAYRGLRDRLERLRDYDNAYDEYGDQKLGIVGQRVHALEEYKRGLGFDTTERAPFESVDATRLGGDESFVLGLLNHARKMRAMAVGDARKAWDERIAKLYAAQAGLDVERKILTGSSGLARRVVSKRKDEILRRFAANRVARPVFSAAAAGDETLREISVRAYARQLMPEKKMSVDDRLQGFQWERALLDERLDVTDMPELQALVDELGEMNLAEAYTVLRVLDRQMTGQAFHDLQLMIEKQMRALGVDPNKYADWLDNSHAHLGSRASLDQYRNLDQYVREAIVAARKGFHRKGSTRAFGGRRSKGRSPLVLADSSSVEVLAKYRALQASGVTMREYDEMRSVLGDISRRDFVQRRLLRASERLSRNNGKSVQENYLALREARRVKEAEYDIEEFANRPENWGLTDEEVFHLWDQQHALDDAAPLKRPLTQYQYRTLKGVFEDMTGFSLGERHLVARRLGAQQKAPKGSRMVKAGEFEGAFDNTSIPVYVVKPIQQGKPVTYAQEQLQRTNALGLARLYDGLYVWEGAHPVTVHHELFHALAFDQMFDTTKAPRLQPLGDWLQNQPHDFLNDIWEELLMDKRYPHLDLEEMFAELYGLRVYGGEFQIGGRTVSWANLRARFTDQNQLFEIDNLGAELDKIEPWVTSSTTWGFGVNAPPLGNRARMRAWLVENGFWSPKTADEIKSGARIWTIDEEREFWDANYGYIPDWTKPDVLRPLLDSPQAYYDKFREWGFFEDDFEVLAAGRATKVENIHDAMAFGADNVRQARTLEEMRYWFAERYGKLASPDGGRTLTAAPWLMDMAEYQSWMGRMGSTVDGLDSLGVKMDPTLATPEMMAGMREAIERATAGHLERVKKAMGDEGLDPDLWLPEERMRFAYDIVDYLIQTKGWSSVWRTEGLAKDFVFNGIGQLQRIFIVWTPAFPIMNAIDAFGPKAALLSLMRNGGRWVHSTKPHWDDLVPTLESVGDDLTLTWGLTKTKPWRRVRDKRFSLPQRMAAGGQTVAQAPLELSALAEGSLRLNFARSVAGRTYDDLVKGGMDKDLAASFARFEGHKALKTFFSVLDDAPEWEKVLNQIVPFFTYTYKNFAMGLRVLWEQPWIVAEGQRLGAKIQEANRATWAELYPGAPFPEDDVDMQRLWVQSPWGTTYNIDLSVFSDWTRSLASAMDGVTVDDIFRVVHPWQTALAGMFTGQETAWGAPADWKNLSPWFGFFDWLSKGAPFNPIDPKSMDTAQWISQMLFFKRFGRIDPVQAEVTTFFGLMQVDEDRAWDYYNAHPNLQGYFQLNGKTVDPTKKFAMNWYTFATPEQVEQYQQALRGYYDLRDSLDAAVKDQWYLQPWEAGASEARQMRYVALRQYLLANPILQEKWMWDSASEWATENEAYRVDLATEDFFNITAPKRGDYANDVGYNRAVLDYLDARKQFLREHPAVVDRLRGGHDAVRNAWYDQELHWASILEDQARRRIEIARENMLSEPDRRKLEILYRISDANYAALDMESIQPLYDAFGTDIDNQRVGPFALGELVSKAIGRAQRLVVLPGRSDWFYNRATPEQRADIRARERYAAGLKGIWDKIGKDYTRFYDELAKNPWLQREYMKRNPEAGKTSAYALGISAIFNKATDGASFFRLLEQNPKLMAEYFRRHPEKAATFRAGKEYFAAISGWVELLKQDKFDAAMKYWDNLPGWVQERYLAKHPESGMRQGGLQATAYASAIGGWVDLLRKNEFEAADKYFKNLPDWVKERYFKNHPDQRAKNEMDDQMLLVGANYFLANDIDKARILKANPAFARWMKEHGGNEAAWRGLIFAIYRAIPSSNPWLKRTFRERYPELFSVEAQGERRRQSVYDELAEHPEMIPYYEDALALQQRLFIEQLRRSKTPPKPLTMERKSRMKKRRKRRAARLHREWSLHTALRRT